MIKHVHKPFFLIIYFFYEISPPEKNFILGNISLKKKSDGTSLCLIFMGRNTLFCNMFYMFCYQKFHHL